IRLEAIGAVQSRSTVQVRSRVDGQLVAAEFREGQWVKKGDLLFRIDPRTFQAQLRQAQANLARDQAQHEKARSDLDRYAQLSQKGFSSQQKYEEAKATLAALQAIIRADQAAVEMAKLQLEFTEIRAPIDGRTGNMLITPGNLIKANDTPALVVINETRPIYVAFSVPESNVADLKARMVKGPLSVTVSLPERPDKRMTGDVTFINNAVDTATGTIQLKATFANDDEILTPGQFVRVAVNLDTLTDALVVPTGAIQDGQKGSYVFVVRSDMTVEPRNVTIGPAADNRTVVRSGVAAGETVVTDGQLRLFPGAPVQPQKSGVADGAPGKADAGKGQAGKRDSNSKGAAKHDPGKDSGKPEARQ
ncbi:MAG: efflux RND transporter periplasmic adaptor subunit, partial [Rhodospirillales bacterium]|nr:efflux RND transporter periplasmic adaptor subunit [Rhodospirillales bacterium]